MATKSSVVTPTALFYASLFCFLVMATIWFVPAISGSETAFLTLLIGPIVITLLAFAAFLRSLQFGFRFGWRGYLLVGLASLGMTVGAGLIAYFVFFGFPGR